MLVAFTSFAACDDLLFKTIDVSDEDYFSKRIAVTKSPDGNKTFYFGEVGPNDTLKSTQLYLQFKDGSGIQVFNCWGGNRNIKPSWRGNDTLIVQLPPNVPFTDKKTEIPHGSKKIAVIYSN
jgi:hypothetical protein